MRRQSIQEMSPEQLRTIQSLSVLGGTKPTTFVSEPVNDGAIEEPPASAREAWSAPAEAAPPAAAPALERGRNSSRRFFGKGASQKTLEVDMENEQEPQEELSKGKPRLADLLNISDLFELSLIHI